MKASMRNSKQIVLLFICLLCHINLVFPRPNTKAEMPRKARSYFNAIDDSYDIDAVNKRGKTAKYPNGRLEEFDTSRTSDLRSEASLEQEFVRNEDTESSNSLQDELKDHSQQFRSKRQSRHPCVNSEKLVIIYGKLYRTMKCDETHLRCRPVGCQVEGQKITINCEWASQTPSAIQRCKPQI